MDRFISCDWGTSSFRLRLVDAKSKVVLAETKSGQGIAATYVLWKEQDSKDRILFYCNIILEKIVLLERQCGYSLDDITIILSGMVSATIGMIELPYKSIPISINKSEFETCIIPATETCRHKMILVSGLCSNNDVMRGEETMLLGCSIADIEVEQIFIFPGTHSKHVVIQNGGVSDFKTYMTGEVFELLTGKSILAVSVEKNDYADKSNASFIKGVRESASSNLLNSIFHVRTNSLFGNLSKEENYHYLSGLLIGYELKTIQQANYSSITVVSSGALLVLYMEALSALGFKEMVQQQNSDEALISGHAVIFNQYQ